MTQSAEQNKMHKDSPTVTLDPLGRTVSVDGKELPLPPLL